MRPTIVAVVAITVVVESMTEIPVVIASMKQSERRPPMKTKRKTKPHIGHYQNSK
jgi:hypothetical protein